MNSNATRSGIVSMLVVLVFIAFAIWLILSFVGEAIGTVVSTGGENAPLILAALITGFASVVSIVVGRIYESKSTLRKEIREKKIPVYESIVSGLFAIMFEEKLGGRRDPDEQIKWFAKSMEEITVWGSDDLVMCFARFKVGLQENQDVGDIMNHFEELLYAIRRDLGHKNRGLGKRTILRMFVNDIDGI